MRWWFVIALVISSSSNADAVRWKRSCDILTTIETANVTFVYLRTTAIAVDCHPGARWSLQRFVTQQRKKVTEDGRKCHVNSPERDRPEFAKRLCRAEPDFRPKKRLAACFFPSKKSKKEIAEQRKVERVLLFFNDRYQLMAPDLERK